MRETILVFGATQEELRLRLQKALMPLKVRLTFVRSEDYGQPLGRLAGLKDLPAGQDVDQEHEISDTMIVFAFLSDEKLGRALTALRGSGAGPLPYKAVLTDTNKFWTPAECLEEQRREHEQLNG